MLPEILLSTLLLAGVYGFPSTPADQLKTPRSEYFIVQPAIKPQPQLLQTYSIQAKYVFKMYIRLVKFQVHVVSSLI